MSILSADRLYDFAASWTGETVVAEHELVEEFSDGVTELLRGLGDELEDSYWVSLRRPLRNLRWRLATVPLPFNSPAMEASATANVVIPRLKRCAAVAPERAATAESLAATLAVLTECADDPLGDKVAKLLEQDSKTAILLTDGHAVSRLGDGIPGARVLTATELMRTSIDTVAAVGASAWFPLRIQQAPRFEKLAFVRYSWIGDRAQDLGMLPGSRSKLRQGFEPGPVRPSRRHENLLAPEEIRPTIEWNAIGRRAREGMAEHWSEPVSARLFLLASRQGVYLEAHETARVNVADVDTEIVVTQERVRRLAEGNFLVVRTSGDGDYVELYANHLLGARAGHLRGIQDKIRQKLHDHVDHLGLAVTAELLRKYGSTIATEGNVRRWAEPGHIVTRDFADFAAICQLIGETNADGYFKAMREVLAAHIKAGHEVRRLLMDELRVADLTPLLRDGWGDYDVEEIEGEGSLRVARITGISPDEVPVPRGRLRKLFGVGDQLWLG